jgi:hypothetical protein
MPVSPRPKTMRNPDNRDRRQDWAWLLGALGCAAALRLWGLTREAVWYDEW